MWRTSPGRLVEQQRYYSIASELQVMRYSNKGKGICKKGTAGGKFSEDIARDFKYNEIANIFRGLRGKCFPPDSRHSNGQKLCPSPS